MFKRTQTIRQFISFCGAGAWRVSRSLIFFSKTIAFKKKNRWGVGYFQFDRKNPFFKVLIYFIKFCQVVDDKFDTIF